MASIQAINWREKFTNILGDYEREMYVWMGKTESEGASSSSCPATEQLQLAISIILQSKPPSLGTGMAGLLGDSLEGGRDGNGKDQACGKEPEAEASVYKRLELGLKGQGFMKNDAQTDRTEMRNCLFAPVGGEKM
ncbi:hypothetical protein NQZ68_025851 [Dissostichus eleginoides]|nr:hypothetical protein NQZ68_025851 [Dissostichus eleginoides]